MRFSQSFLLFGFISFMLTLFSYERVDASGGDRLSDDLLRQSIVLVRISNLRYDYSRPWIAEPAESYTVIGAVVDQQRVMVLASDVRQSVHIEVMRPDHSARAEASIEILDSEANLALLRLNEADFMRGARPLSFGNDLLPGEPLRAVKVDSDFRIYRESGHVMEVRAAADFGFTYLPLLLFRTLEPFRNGGLILCNEGHSIACGFIGYSDREQRVEAMQPSVITAFLRQATEARRSEEYRGFPVQGFELEPLEDPTLRRYLALPSDRSGGARVSEVLPFSSAWGTLRSGDVLFSIDGVEVDSRGLYSDANFGRQSALLLLTRSPDGTIRRVGEQVELEILRDGRIERPRLVLRLFEGRAERVSWRITAGGPWLVEAGLVFVELSVPYMQQVGGPNWRRSLIELSNFYTNSRFYESEEQNDRVVVLSEVLPLTANIGFEELRRQPITLVDGEPLESLSELSRRIEAASAAGVPFLELQSRSGQRIYLPISTREKWHQEVKRRYQLPHPAQLD